MPRYDTSGNTAYNVINVLAPAVVTMADLNAVATVFEAWERNESRTARTSVTQPPSIHLTALAGAGSIYLDKAYVPPTILGAVAGQPITPNVTIAVSLRTGLGGKSYHGRIYHCGLPVSWAQPTGLIASIQQAAILACYQALMTRLSVAGYQLCVLSQYSGIDAKGMKVPRASGIATPVTSILVGNRLDTQRRRLPDEVRP